MRHFTQCAALLLAASLSVTQVLAQVEGDPVTTTNGGIVYTGVLDADLDPVSYTIASTILTTGPVLATTTTPPVVAPITTTRAATTTAPAAAAGGAALGGGAGVVTTQTGLQTISGYVAPAQTIPPSPTNYSSGTILSASDIPGYTGQENSSGVSSGAFKLGVAKVVLGGALGAVVFAVL